MIGGCTQKSGECCRSDGFQNTALKIQVAALRQAGSVVRLENSAALENRLAAVGIASVKNRKTNANIQIGASADCRLAIAGNAGGTVIRDGIIERDRIAAARSNIDRRAGHGKQVTARDLSGRTAVQTLSGTKLIVGEFGITCNIHRCARAHKNSTAIARTAPAAGLRNQRARVEQCGPIRSVAGAKAPEATRTSRIGRGWIGRAQIWRTGGAAIAAAAAETAQATLPAGTSSTVRRRAGRGAVSQ